MTRVLEVSEVKPTERLLGLLFLMGFFVSLELVFQHRVSEQSIYIIAVIVGFILSMRILTELSARQIHLLRGERVFLDPLNEGGEVRVRVRIVNDGWIPLLKASITDQYPNMFHLVSGANGVDAIIPSKGSVEFTYTVKPVMGMHRFRGVEIIVSDPFKIFNYRAILSIREEYVRVKPKPVMIPRRIRVPAASRFLGLGKIHVKGIGQEFYSIREYYPGDDYRFIEWKAFARSRRLYVKEFEKEASLSIILVLYANRDSIRGRIGSTVFEYMARTATGIARNMLDRGDWVELLLVGSEILSSGYSRGRIHFYDIVNTISSFNWKPAEDIDLGRVLIEESKRIPRRTKNYYVVFTTTMDKRMAELFIGRAYLLRRRRHSIIVVQAIPELFEEKALRATGEIVYSAPLIERIMEVRNIALFLRKHGIITINVGPDDMLNQTIYVLERYRAIPV